MSKYTPGPWVVNTYSNYHGWSIYAGDAGCIAERWYSIERTNAENEQMAANARLIAAAPELAEALQKIADGSAFQQDEYGTCVSDARSVARAALKKAGIE